MKWLGFVSFLKQNNKELFSFRGMESVFGTWYGQISQLRSLLPSGTPLLALTATSTHHVYDVITKSLHMQPLISILLPPNRTNIRYSIEKVSRDIYKTFQWLVEDLIRTRSAHPKTLVFCRSTSTCAALYKFFITTMREKSLWEGDQRLVPVSLQCIMHESVRMMNNLYYNPC